MTSKNFKHINPDEYHGKELTLHDCIADKISFENNSLRFYLPDGFWVTTHHKANPSGKTPVTFVSNEQELPALDDYNIKNGRSYQYFKGEVLFPFGYGLSYTNFEYSNMSMTYNKETTTYTIKVTVTNIRTARSIFKFNNHIMCTIIFNNRHIHISGL